MPGYPSFSLWISIALAKVYFFPHGPNLEQKPLYLEGIVPKGGAYCKILALLPIVFVPCANDPYGTNNLHFCRAYF